MREMIDEITEVAKKYGYHLDSCESEMPKPVTGMPYLWEHTSRGFDIPCASFQYEDRQITLVLKQRVEINEL